MKALINSCVLLIACVASAHAAGFVVANHQAVGPNLDLDASKTYLHKLDFPADGFGATVNGVEFSAVPGGSGTDPLTGNPYSLLMNNPSDFAGDGLLGDFIHNGGQQAGSVETLTLGGFVPGTTYDVRLYYRNFGPRPQNVTFDSDGIPGAEHSMVLDQATSSDENYWSVVFQADAPTLTIAIAQQVFNASWHQYAVSSEVVPGESGVPVTIASQPQNVIGRIGGRATFRVATSGTQPMTFQWRKDGFEILDATNMVFSIASVSAEDTGDYDVVIGNGVGDAVTSEAANLSLGPEFELAVDRVPVIHVEGVPGRMVTLEYKNSLDEGTGWQTLTNVTLTGGSAVVVDTAAPESNPRFYRGVQ